MAYEVGGRDNALAPEEVATLVTALSDPEPDVRIAMFEALSRLPLHPTTWAEVAAYAIAAVQSSEAPNERLAVVDAAPAVPVRSLRASVALLAQQGDGEIASRAAKAMAKIAEPRVDPSWPEDWPLRPHWAGGEPPGFAVGVDLAPARSALAHVPLWPPGGADDVTYPYFVLGREARRALGVFGPAAVTVLFERAVSSRDTILGNDTTVWVSEMQGAFQPDLEGLFHVYHQQALQFWRPGGPWFPNFFDSGIEVFERWICWQIGWTVSRGGLRGLVPVLAPHLGSDDMEERLAAACLIADAADYSIEAVPPTFGGGFGPERRMAATVIDRGPTPAAPAAGDDDVQFSVYRPRLVRPQRWYPLLVFAHRTTVFQDADGTVVDPVASVERQARALLFDQAVPFEAVRTDSPRIERGTELVFQAWLEGGEINPIQASVRWEEPIHRLEFRLRAPASADGGQLRGGVRVFRSGLLIGEVTFRVSVSATAPVTAPPSDRLVVTRYRRIFASYSHKDADIVQLVADYVEATGDEYLIDVRNLRSGEQWAARLEELIADADVFQLFWSRNSMTSPFVREEWEYALGLGRDDFIRPIYWEQPMPADPARGLPPEALRQLHFSQLPLGPAHRRHDRAGGATGPAEAAVAAAAPGASVEADRPPLSAPRPPAQAPPPACEPEFGLTYRGLPEKAPPGRRLKIGLAVAVLILCIVVLVIVVASLAR